MPNATIATEPAAATLEVRRTFAATRQRVFNAWTTAEALKQWHAPENAEDRHFVPLRSRSYEPAAHVISRLISVVRAISRDACSRRVRKSEGGRGPAKSGSGAVGLVPDTRRISTKHRGA